MGERCERREAPPEQRGGIMAEQQDTPIDWAGEAKHLYRLADACRSERLSLIEAWDKWAARTAIEASDSGYKAILQGDPPGWDAPDRVVDMWWALEHSAELLEEAAGLVAAVGTVPMTGATSESIMADDCLDMDTKMVLAARWGDRGKPDVTYKYDKGDKQ